MRTHRRPSPTATTFALLALACASPVTRAETAPTNAGQRYVSIGAQADNQHDRQVLSTLSLPVGRQAWVRAGVGKSRSDPAADGRQPGIVTAGAGVAGQALQLTVDASHRADGSKYRQTDVGASLDWHHEGHVVGLDVTHRNARATGTAAAAGSTATPVQARVSGNGVGVHGTLQATAHASVYGAIARNHYRSTTQRAGQPAPGGLLGLGRALLGGSSVVNRDEAALDHSAMIGASWRWDKVALSGEYTTGQLHDAGGALRSVELKAAVEVAPGWRVAPGVGRGTSDQGGHATFASLAATYGW